MTGPRQGDPSYQNPQSESYWQQQSSPQWQQQWQPPPTLAGYGYQPYGYGYGPAGPPPPNHIGWAIAAIILFWPLAIPAFIYSSRVESAWYRGDLAGARRASANTRTCGIWAIVVGVASFVLFFAISVLLIRNANFVTP
jgi:hypothetical protein